MIAPSLDGNLKNLSLSYMKPGLLMAPYGLPLPVPYLNSAQELERLIADELPGCNA